MTDAPTRPAGRGKSILVPAVVAVVAAVVLAVALLGGSGSDAGAGASPDSGTDPGKSGTGGDDGQQWGRRIADDPMAMGDQDAPVVLVAYSDFQCPFCGKFARDTEPLLVDEYVDDGTLRIEWRDFPYLGQASLAAAKAARAAAAQGKFWQFHDALYADQPPPNSGRLDAAFLDGIAGEVGLSLSKFHGVMQSAEASAAIWRDFEQGQQAGVTGTPAFFVNGRPIMGAQPVDVFRKEIERAAQEAQ